MLSALLIQLFGRDVIDRLAQSGFDTNEAIARAGVDRLSDEGGIPASLARRIIAVAVETPIADEAGQAPPGATAKRPKSRKSARSRKRDTTSTVPQTSQDPTAASPDAGAMPDDETSQWPSHSLDAFVDDASLVSFMGLIAKGGSPNPSRFSVAEEILDADPVTIPFGDEPDATGTVPSPAGPAAASSLTPGFEEAPGPAASPGTLASPASGSDAAIPEDSRANRPQARPGAAVVAESFWGFGTPVEGIDTLCCREESSRGPGPRAQGDDARAGSGFENPPRRRRSDGH